VHAAGTRHVQDASSPLARYGAAAVTGISRPYLGKRKPPAARPVPYAQRRPALWERHAAGIRAERPTTAQVEEPRVTQQTIFRVEPYSIVQEFWGEQLSDELVARVASAPKSHVHEFEQAAGEAILLQDDALPELPRAHLRPLLFETGTDSIQYKDFYRYLDTAARLLCYSHQVVVEEPFLHHRLGGAKDVSALLQRLHRLQPLAARGDLLFARVEERQRHPSRNFGLTSSAGLDPELLEAVRAELTALAAGLPPEDQGRLSFRLGNYFGMTMRMAMLHPDLMHLITRSPSEEVLLKIALANGAMLSRRTNALRLSNLARLTLPGLQLPTEELVRVRQDEDNFAAWRDSLGKALDQIDLIAPSDTWDVEAAAVVQEELTPFSDKLARAVKKSPALTALTKASQNLSLAAAGAAAGGAAGGSWVPAVAGGAATKLLEGVKSYLEERQEQRADRAVQAVCASFFA